LITIIIIIIIIIIVIIIVVVVFVVVVVVVVIIITISMITIISTTIDVALEGMLTSDEIASARRKREIDEKMRIMIREILFYVLFLFFILLVVNGQQDNWSFQQNQNLVYTLTSPVLNNVVCIMCPLRHAARPIGNLRQGAKI